MPVYKLEEDMPYTELIKWVAFFKKYPTGWREDQRTFMLLQAQGFKGRPESVFPSLKQMKDNVPTEIKALPKGKFLEKMLAATGGDNSGWVPPWMETK